MGIFNRKQKIQENNAPDEAALLKYIAKLTPEDIDNLASIARNDPRSADELSKSMTDYIALVQSVFGTSFNTVGNTPQTRNQRYDIYEEMDESTAYISSALDILSDDATQADEDGVVIHINSASEKINNLVEEFIIEFELEDKMSKWARAVAKYGDLFIKVDGEYNKGVISIIDTIYPGMVDRRDLNGKLVAFSNNQDVSNRAESLYAPWEFVHFRHKGDIYKEEKNTNRLNSLSGDDAFDQNLTSAYGQSILRPAIKVYAQLRFVENMILLSRLTNSIRRNIFLINVGDVAPDKAFETIANYARLLKKDINLNIEEGIYSSAKHTVNYDEDIFIPVNDPQNDVRIESVGGDANIGEQYDLEYLQNKLFSALKIPKAYLNYEQDLNARSTLIQLDIRYARSVSQLQQTMTAGLRRLIMIHLAYHGLNPDEIDLEVTLTPVSAIDDEARITQQQTQIQAARDMFDLLDTMKDRLESSGEDAPKLNLESAVEYIMEDYLELDKSIINQIFGRKEEDDETPLGRVNSHRIYRGTDIMAMYPTTADKLAYEKIRESLTAPQDTEVTEEIIID